MFSISGCSSDDSSSPTTTPCPQGYTGPACLTQVTPSKIKITKITVKSFPMTNGGFDWDSVIDGGADIDVRLFDSNELPVFISDNYYPDATTGNDYSFTPPQPIVITNMNQMYFLELYDYDGNDSVANEDDFMGSSAFFPYSSTSGFPETKLLTNGQLEFELTLEYEW